MVTTSRVTLGCTDEFSGTGETGFMKRILVTGATGKVGSHFIQRLLNSPDADDVTIRALCHNRRLEARTQLEVLSGSISDRDVVRAAMDGVSHVIHCATCKRD